MISVDVRTAWVGSGLAIAATAMLAVGFCFVAVLGNRTEVQRDGHPPPITRVEVDAGGADLTVVGGGGDEVVVERRLMWFLQRPDAVVERTGEILRIRTGGEPWITEDWLPGVRRSLAYVLTVPDGVYLDLQTGSGDVTLQDVRGSWRVSTRDGDVTGTGLRSEGVTIESRSGSADLEFAGLPRTVTVTASTGDIAIAVPPGGYHVAVDTGGDLFLAVPDTPSAGRRLSALSEDGDVQVTYR